jgi:hypothetical protein
LVSNAAKVIVWLALAMVIAKVWVASGLTPLPAVRVMFE